MEALAVPPTGSRAYIVGESQRHRPESRLVRLTNPPLTSTIVLRLRYWEVVLVPLVFIHGVGVREGPSYYENVEARDSLFRRYALEAVVSDPRHATIVSPYWGKHGAKFYWNHECLPEGGVEALGADDSLAILLISGASATEYPDESRVLLELARQSMVEVVDVLWAGASEHVKRPEIDGLADLVCRAADFARNNEHPDWIDRADNDDEFLRLFIQAVNDWRPIGDAESKHDVEDWEALGFNEGWDRIKEGADRIQNALGNRASRVIVNIGRSAAHRQASLFLGDIGVYLNERGTRDRPGPIIEEVIEGLEQARAHQRDGDDKLIVVAHSMGGNIAYDVLTHFQSDFEVDVLVTVGSQVGLLEELKLFVESDHGLPNQQQRRVPRPTNVRCWLNVFDPNDMLGYATARIFDGVIDCSYSTGKGLLAAHSMYLARPSFHHRLGERIRIDCL